MRLLYLALVSLMCCLSFAVNAQDTPNPSPEHPAFAIIDGALYADLGNGAEEILAASTTRPLVAVYTPIEGLPVILAKDTEYNDTLIRVNLLPHPENGFEMAGYTQISMYPFQEPILFGEDGSIAFIQIKSTDSGTENLAVTTVVIQNNHDFTDFDSISKQWVLSPNLPVMIQDDGTVKSPRLSSYTANLEDLSQSLAEVEMPNGETFTITTEGITLVGEDSPAAEFVFPEDGQPYATLGEITFMTDIKGVFFNVSSHADGNILIYTTLEQTDVSRYDWLYWVSLKPFKVREVIQLGAVYSREANPMLLEGHTALTPDEKTLLYTAYNDIIGASLWKIDLTEQPPVGYDSDWDEPWYPTSVLLVSGMPFIADAGNFALPRFIEVTDETITLEAYIYDNTAPISLAYTLDGQLIEP